MDKKNLVMIVRDLKSWWQKNNKIKQAYEDYFVYQYIVCFRGGMCMCCFAYRERQSTQEEEERVFMCRRYLEFSLSLSLLTCKNVLVPVQLPDWCVMTNCVRQPCPLCRAKIVLIDLLAMNQQLPISSPPHWIGWFWRSYN